MREPLLATSYSEPSFPLTSGWKRFVKVADSRNEIEAQTKNNLVPRDSVIEEPARITGVNHKIHLPTKPRS